MRVPSTDDVSLELHDLGGDGPALLVAHATGFCAGAYRPLARALGSHFHVWALDFRAHGDSTLPSSGDLTWRGMADDVLAVATVLADPTDPSPGGSPGRQPESGEGPASEPSSANGQSEGPEPAGAGPPADAGSRPGAGRAGLYAVGHSMGGAALMAAERRVPGTLRAAYLFEPIIVPPDFGSGVGSNPLAESARRRRPSFPSRSDALARYASRPPLGIFRADALAAYVEHGFADAPDGSVTLKCTPDAEAAVFEAGGKPLISEMATITTPTVVAYGGADLSPGPADFAATIADTLVRGRQARHPHLTHFGPFQDPDAIARQIVETFLG